MKIDNIYSGIDFENYVYDIFASNGFKVSDTPKSNDYGADLIVDYNDYRFCIQCKYYSKSVGVKATQEVMGALNYYQCDYGIVITNSIFTQQAENLASMNNILLIDGDELLAIREKRLSLSKMLNQFLNQIDDGHVISKPFDEWLINDLVVRYGVSSGKIYKDFLGEGLPYYKVGREYRFNPNDVKEWEIYTKKIAYKKNEELILPGYLDFRDEIKQRIRAAKKSKDTEELKRIKTLLKKYDIHPVREAIFNVVKLIFVGVVIVLMICLVLSVIPVR